MGRSHSPSPERRRRDRDDYREERRPRSLSRERDPRGRRRSASPTSRRSRKESPSRHHKRRRSHSRSRSRSRSRSSGSPPEGDDGDRKRHHKSSRKHKHRRSSHSRERKEKKKSSKKDKQKRKGAVTSQWGQYGLISESDLYNKEDEFRAWLIEEKMVNRETIPKDQEKKLFSQFVEDFNTATLPHEKYYNMAKYDTRMNMLRNGETVPRNSEYDPSADLAAHSASHKRTVVEHDSFLSKDQLLALRKVQMERIEAGKMKVLGLEVKTSMGVRMDGNAFEPGRR